MFKPVTFDADNRGGCRTADSARAAARILMMLWNDTQGTEYYFAIRACLDAIEGRGSDESAREAFVAALHATGVFVLE